MKTDTIIIFVIFFKYYYFYFLLLLLLLLLFFFFFGGGGGEILYLDIFVARSPWHGAIQPNTNYAYFVKVYLYPPKYFDMWKGLNQHAVKIEKYSSNENDKIIHFKVKGLRGDYQNSD